MRSKNHPSVAMFVGGSLDPNLGQRVRDGLHPQTEYLRLAQEYEVELVGFDDVGSQLYGREGKIPMLSGINGLALLGGVRTNRWSHVLATGEDIGLRIALGRALTGRRGGKLSILMHGSYFGSRKLRPVLRIIKLLPNIYFLCISETLATRLVENHRVSQGQVTNVSYGVDTTFFTPGLDTTGPARICAAGMAYRDYRTLVRATTNVDVEVRIAADSAWFRSELDIRHDLMPPNVIVKSAGDYLGLRTVSEFPVRRSSPLRIGACFWVRSHCRSHGYGQGRDYFKDKLV